MNGLQNYSFSSSSQVSNHIARRVGHLVQRRIDALKVGQKMQDLPEELWHDSFRYYVKEDPNRKGGPNLRLIRLDPNRPSLTVTGYIFNKFVHPFEDRFITVREAARLQGFPDSLCFAGTLTSTQMQVGNAVPIALAQSVFEVLINTSVEAMLGNTLTALSLFSGAGGMDIGASQSTNGFIHTKIAIDSWKDACLTLQNLHQNKTIVLNQDITTIDDPKHLWFSYTHDNETPDIVYGGPPCQAFSQAGKQKALDDERGTMIGEFLRFVAQLKPKFFIMENVSNLRGVGGGTLYKHILHTMRGIGYNVNVGVLLAADFGTPQLRNRLFFIGSRNDLKVGIPLPEATHVIEPNLFALKPYVTVGEAFSGLPTAKFSSSRFIQ